MIETANSEIDVEELMQRVRTEAAKLRNGASRTGNSAVRQRAFTLPAVRVLPPPPRLPLFRSVDPKKERLDSILEQAREKSAGNSQIPKIFRRFSRKQGGYNRLLADAAASLAKAHAQLAKRLNELGAAVETQSRWLRSLAEYRQSDTTWMRTATQQISAIADEVSELRAASSEGTAPSGANEAPSAGGTTGADTAQLLRELRAEIQILRTEVDELKASQNRTTADRIRPGAGG